MIFVFAASASFQINPFGSCIFVSCSSPVTGFLKLSTSTFTIPGTEKLLLFPSILTLISTNCGSRKRLNVPANNAKGPSPYACPETICISDFLCSSFALFVISSKAVPLPSWIAFGHDSATIKSRPSSLVSP
jgi:hypothetical protein